MMSTQLRPQILTGHRLGHNMGLVSALWVAGICIPGTSAAPPAVQPVVSVAPETPAQLFPLHSVRLLGKGPFAPAVAANLSYMLAVEPDRLLAPFRREAGLPPKASPYGNWESSGLDGHTAGHYLSALSHMIAAGADTPDGLLRSRLTHMLNELQACQAAFGDGYLGGVPGSRELWRAVAAGDIQAADRKWVPWYNLHKTFAGLRDVYLETGDAKARELLVKFGDWCVTLTGHLTDGQMQQMLGNEHGGMNEVMADIYAITGDKRYLETARRFNHHAVLDPLIRHEDQLTGKHANTQIPKVIGLERIATLTGDKGADSGARYFWENVVGQRSVAFGGNSVSEHFNDPKDFQGLLMHREGPETCNSYNMLRLTEQLFASGPKAAYADYYERALYNHLLASINPAHPGYVYFTPIRPAHYRVYSEPSQSFWCCVGTGMENPGKYGEFIYGRGNGGLYVNLFIASELTVPEMGLVLRQDTNFPEEEHTRLTLKLAAPRTFTLYLRQPGWVASGAFGVRVNGKRIAVNSGPSSYVPIRREWKNGDRVELDVPMQTSLVGLPDGSPWYAILHGPIVLAAPSGTWDMAGLRADDSRMAHVAAGPVLPLDQAPVLLADPATVTAKVVPDPASGPLHFRLMDIVQPAAPQGVPLLPFYRLHDSRYQVYWELTTREGLSLRREQRAAEERARIARESATLDMVAPGEQQPEVEHAYKGEETSTGIYNGRHWRHGRQIEYTLNTRNASAVTLSVTYSGDDAGRMFDIFANNSLVATQQLVAEKRGAFVEKLYKIPAAVLASAPNHLITIRFVGRQGLAGGIYDVRLLRADSAPVGAVPMGPSTHTH
ncbi:MAG TPA: glycoside hydrolase family 127 protein [Holophaga sp.]|nr:glycoside hydrolase family 127 protein [Holophaga sp.]